MTDLLLLPYSTGNAIDLATGSRLWRKQILKKGSVKVNGQTVVFDDAWCADLAAAFKDGTYDQVAFQLVDGKNNHTLDPERFRGEVKAVIPTDDGLDAILDLSEDGDDLVRKNPRLGVSCGIREGVGKFGRAIQHVAATLDPRIPGMSPWVPVELSTPGDRVVDLTQSPYERENTVPELTEEELAQFRALLAEKNKPAEPAAPAVPVGVTPAPAKAEPAAADTGLDPELERAIADLLAAETTEPAKVPVAAGVELSAETVRALELAQANENQRAIELSQIRSELDAERYRRESAELAAAGVPPKLIELSRPLLEGSNRVIELSNGAKVDAGTVIRAVLDELKGTIDLSGEFGGRQISSNQTPDEPTAARDLVAQFKAQFGRNV